MLYALILVISTTTRIEQFTPAPDWPVQVGASYLATIDTQKLVAYYDTERACLRASTRPNGAWPAPAPGQRVRAICMPVPAQQPAPSPFGAFGN
ncbi:hypothetical protein [Xanthobacter variabilis]|uniref:hypothetical protein n=1 Tax=Xanthobacter variabilis TaxID=3119932 RepID=UPI0037270D29